MLVCRVEHILLHVMKSLSTGNLDVCSVVILFPPLANGFRWRTSGTLQWTCLPVDLPPRVRAGARESFKPDVCHWHGD